MRLEQNARPGVGPATQKTQNPRMRVGIALPRFGELADPLSIARVAQHAEKLGYDTAWILEQDADGIPDALTVFSYLAGRTKALGFATWLTTGECGARELLRRVGSANTVAGGRLSVAVNYPAGYYDGSVAYQVPARLIEVTPPSSRTPIPATAAVVRCQVTFQPIEGARAPFSGSFDQIGEDIARYRDFGVSEIVLDLAYSGSISRLGDYLFHMEQLRAAAEPGWVPASQSPAWPYDDFDTIT